MSVAEKLQTIAENEQKVFDAGKQAEYDRFWDAQQDYGNRSNYYFAFNSWVYSTVKPKYDVKPSGSGSIREMFRSVLGAVNSHKIKMSDLENECGIRFDFSNASGNAQSVFHDTIFSELNDIDFSNVTDLTYAFFSSVSTGVTRINRLILGAPFAFYAQPFGYNTRLEYCGFEGTIDPKHNNLSLQWSTKLAKECLVAFLNCLADKTTDTSGTAWAITLGTTNLAKLTEAEIAIATEKGWSLT